MKKRFFALSSTFLILSIAISVTLASEITVNTESLHQTMNGFGGACVYLEKWLTAHPNKEEIYDLIFKDLNPDILCIRNSSWSPPAYLKKNGVLNGGTLPQAEGEFVYDEFAWWWYDSIVAYTKIGISPTYISMQNDPDYENTALSKLHEKLKDYPEKPLIPAPEVTGAGADNFQYHVDTLDRSIFDIYAYHLYNGGQRSDPDAFNTNLEAIKINYADKPDIMTEYSHDGRFSTAWIIQTGEIFQRS